MIAHQWRQPLNIIGVASSVINQKLRRGKLSEELSQELTQRISANIDYLSSTIDDFRTFFRPDKKNVRTDFKKIIDKTMSLVNSSLENNKIKLNIDVLNLKEFMSYENELVQVVLNMMKNSEDVLTQKGIENPEINIVVDNMILKISDNGGGIPEKILDKIYDPYFSTKLDKEGTGLGLYMSKIIVDEHCGGVLSVKNINNGAMFIIDLTSKV